MSSCPSFLWSIEPYLSISGYNLPWEDPSFQYPGNFARPLEVAIEASNGASDYGNKFGEPVLAGEPRGVKERVTHSRGACGRSVTHGLWGCRH